MIPVTGAYDAIVLGGGRGSRLGGVDKPALQFEGLSLADRAIRAVAGARAVAFVSHGTVPSARPLNPRIRVVREEPRFGGPVAAIAAGLAGLDDRPEAVTVVLAGDLVDPAPAVAALLAHRTAATDGVVAVDPDGVRQPMLAVYRTAALTAAVSAVVSAAEPGDADGRGPSMRAVIGRLELSALSLPARWCADVDTPADAARHGILVPGEVRRADAA